MDIKHMKTVHGGLFMCLHKARPRDRILCELVMLKCNKDLMQMKVFGVTS